VFRGAHEKEHGEGDVEGYTAGEIAPIAEFGCVRRHGRAIGGGLAGPLDEALLDAPNDAPDIQEHDEAEASANSDAEMAVGGVGGGVEVEGDPGGSDQQDGYENGAQGYVVYGAFPGHLQRIEKDISDDPSGEPFAEPFPKQVGIAAVDRVTLQNDGEIAQADQHGDYRGPAEPPHGA
jgi:hypothetical protein